MLELKTDDWTDLIDENRNDDCRKLKNNNADSFGNPYPIYAVVDGQQRLTTIFLLAHVLSKIQQPKLLINLFAPLKSGEKVPRLIQSPSDDHLFMKQMLVDYEKGNNIANTKSAAQKRLKEGLELTDVWATNNSSAINRLSDVKPEVLVSGLRSVSTADSLPFSHKLSILRLMAVPWPLLPSAMSSLASSTTPAFAASMPWPLSSPAFSSSASSSA